MLRLYSTKTHKPISQNFHSKEFACPCCDYALIDMELIVVLEALRALVGKPVGIARGYSCPKHNESIPGAATESKHLMGMAADPYWDGMVMDLADKPFKIKVKQIHWSTSLMGIGWGKTKLHVDVDMTREKITEWTY